MSGRGRRVWVLVAAMVLLAVAGCAGQPKASIRYVTGGPDETVAYDLAVFQFARGEKVQIMLFRRTAAQIGEADPDFEFVLFELPERPHYGWVKEDNVPAYRWVRDGSRDHLWCASAGLVSLRTSDDKQYLHLDFQATMEPVSGTPGGVYVLSGRVRCTEDIVLAQGLMNRYGDWLLTLVGKKPKEPPKPPAKSPAVPQPKKKSKSPI